jgi:hypothetical protein
MAVYANADGGQAMRSSDKRLSPGHPEDSTETYLTKQLLAKMVWRLSSEFPRELSTAGIRRILSR